MRSSRSASPFVRDDLQPALFEGVCEGLRKGPDLSGQLGERQADLFQYIHADFLFPVGRCASFR